MPYKTMGSEDILVIVFHSYPTKPCVDGNLATAFIMKYCGCKYKLVPYWRTHQCFERLKRTLENSDIENTSILYVDCVPDLDVEVEYLLKIIDQVNIQIYDHHPSKPDSLIKKLEKNGNFKYVLDQEICAAEMVIEYILKDKEKDELKMYSGLLQLIHFSEYEGVNDELSCQGRAAGIANAAFTKAMESACDDNAKYNLQKVKEMDMALYYILDWIMPVPSDWKFLFDVNTSDDEICEKYSEQLENYLKCANLCVSGESRDAYSEEQTKKYIDLLDDMQCKLKTGVILKSRKIGQVSADVFICHIDILVYGRSLEPFLRNTLKEKGAQYAILMNSPTVSDNGEKSYYFSLRCIYECGNDARELAAYVKEVSGSNIGGGHPWASGVTLNYEQHCKLFEKEQLNELL